ncbi:hypothetical protein J6590_058360 [Homalodisca vitripennis]|nr:hypothetical protein J6590_058360 [Homalodisca vitripennis]
MATLITESRSERNSAYLFYSRQWWWNGIMAGPTHRAQPACCPKVRQDPCHRMTFDPIPHRTIRLRRQHQSTQYVCHRGGGDLSKNIHGHTGSPFENINTCPPSLVQKYKKYLPPRIVPESLTCRTKRTQQMAPNHFASDCTQVTAHQLADERNVRPLSAKLATFSLDNAKVVTRPHQAENHGNSRVTPK